MKKFMEIVNNFKEVEYLNSLIRLNHDRVTCYALANRLLNESNKGLRTTSIFSGHIAECIKNINELSQEVKNLNGEPSIRCTLIGSFLLMCMEIRVLVSRHRIRATLNCCEQINSMAMNGYTLFQTEISISGKLKGLLSSQKSSLQASFNFFKSYRESYRNSYLASPTHKKLFAAQF